MIRIFYLIGALLTLLHNLDLVKASVLSHLQSSEHVELPRHPRRYAPPDASFFAQMPQISDMDPPFQQWDWWSRNNDTCCFHMTARIQGLWGHGKHLGQIRLEDSGIFKRLRRLRLKGIEAGHDLGDRMCHRSGFLFSERGKFCGFNRDRGLVCELDQAPEWEKVGRADFIVDGKKGRTYLVMEKSMNWIICNYRAMDLRNRIPELYKLPYSSDTPHRRRCRGIWLENGGTCFAPRANRMPADFHIPNRNYIDQYYVTNYHLLPRYQYKLLSSVAPIDNSTSSNQTHQGSNNLTMAYRLGSWKPARHSDDRLDRRLG